MVKAKNGGQYQKQYFLCILAYGVEVIRKNPVPSFEKKTKIHLN
jgi:hypothetical protein